MGMKLRVAYARRRYKDKVYETPLVVTSYRDEEGVSRNKTIASLAKLPKYIVELVEEGLKRGDASALDECVPLREITYPGSVVVGPAFVVLTVLRQLGIYDAVMSSLPGQQAAAILNIVVERAVAAKPLSVMAQQRRFGQEPLAFLLGWNEAPSLKTWYAALATLESRREEMLQELFARNHAPGDLYLYDITSSYFEGETCPLAEYGHNRDGKKGKKQVVLGVICDADGCPIWMDVFKGNTSDQTTVKQELLNLKTKLGLEGFTFVGDRGMVTHARIEELEKEGWWEEFSYITALTRHEMMALVEDEHHPIQLELFDHQRLTEVEHEGTRYVLCHNPQREERDRETRLRLLALTEKKLESLRANVAAGRVKKKDVIARRLYRWLNRWGMERFFTVACAEGVFTYACRQDEVKRYARLDGCYVIRSNVAPERQTTEDLRDRYKDLKYVEQAFRTMKTTDIQTRPIRHFNEPQVRGHLFACFLAYRVIWELRQRLAPVLARDPDTKRCEAGSLAEIWRELSGITVAKLEVRGKTHLKISHITPYAHKLLALCRVPSLETILSE
jgi:transposase